MVKNIIARYNEQDFEFIESIKNKSNKSWEEFIMVAAKCYDSQQEGVN